jgi:DNA-binding CsgD family transcriptional regulator
MPDAEPCDSIWDVLSCEPGIGLSVLGLDGVIHFANQQVARLYTDQPAAAVVGRRLEEVVPPEIAEQTLARGAMCLQEGRAIASRMIWRGRQIINTYHPLTPESEGEAHQFFVVSQATGVAEAPETELTSEYVDLGELGDLTPRELEVLALIGQGLRIAEIARLLHRSERTIEKHREAIGRKLNQTDRVKLALIAARAGLRVEDAKLKRLRPEME